jgi:hypothetical protein
MTEPDMTAPSPAVPPPLPDPVAAPVPSQSSPWSGIGAGLALGAVLGVGAATLDLFGMPPVERSALVTALGALLVVVAVALTTFVHELGHLAGGMLAGWTPHMLIWGPFKFVRERGGWRTERNRSLALAGGMALAVPGDANGGVRQTAMMILGGPVASLLLGVLCLAGSRGVVRAMAGTGDVPRVIAAEALLFAGLASLAAFAATLLMMQTGGFLTDGARLRRILRGGPTADRDRALMTLVGLSVSDRRPREWPRALVAHVRDARDGSPFDAIGPLFAFYHALDTGDPAGAHAAIALVHERMAVVPPAARGSYATEFAFYELAVRGDRARGRAWLDLHGETAFDDRLVRPMLLAMANGERTRALALAAEIEGRTGADRMRAELARAALG